jgi:hypothetical protein
VGVKHLLKPGKACVIVGPAIRGDADVDLVFSDVYLTHPARLDLPRVGWVDKAWWECNSRSPYAGYQRDPFTIAIVKYLFKPLLLLFRLAEDPLALAYRSNHKAFLIHIVRMLRLY